LPLQFASDIESAGRRTPLAVAFGRQVGLVRVDRTFAIITTCMGRLSHLKLSLPKTVAQAAREMIVVDFSCPDGSGEYVRANTPAVQVVTVEGQSHFSNWRARNSGARVATSDVLVFVDADTLLADGAIEWLAEHLPPRAYGFFTAKDSAASNRRGPAMGSNQLKGFHVVPSAAFRKVGGYDEVFEGYASGADTDLEDRLGLIGLKRFPLDRRIVDSVVEHDTASRLQHHKVSISESYFAGLLYRTAKLHVLRLVRKTELDLATRRRLYVAASSAAARLTPSQERLTMTVRFDRKRVWVPAELQRGAATKGVSLHIDVALGDPAT
jgi:glycosyltransferase involved in cell wall biosynthesis